MKRIGSKDNVINKIDNEEKSNNVTDTLSKIDKDTTSKVELSGEKIFISNTKSKAIASGVNFKESIAMTNTIGDSSPKKTQSKEDFDKNLDEIQVLFKRFMFLSEIEEDKNKDSDFEKSLKKSVIAEQLNEINMNLKNSLFFSKDDDIGTLEKTIAQQFSEAQKQCIMLNPKFEETNYKLEEGKIPSEALLSFFIDGVVGLECFDVVCYYKTVLDIIGSDKFDQLFAPKYFLFSIAKNTTTDKNSLLYKLLYKTEKFNLNPVKLLFLKKCKQIDESVINKIKK